MSKRHKNPNSQNIGGMFTFALVGLFSILALLVAVVGVQAYQSVLDSNDLNHETRTSLSYFINKVRSSDSRGYVSIGVLNDNDALLIDHDYGGELYQTRIYFFEGALYEQLVELGEDFYPEIGQELVSVQAFTVQMVKPGLIGMSVTTNDGETHTVHMAVRSYVHGRG